MTQNQVQFSINLVSIRLTYPFSTKTCTDVDHSLIIVCVLIVHMDMYKVGDQEGGGREERRERGREEGRGREERRERGREEGRVRGRE